MTARRPFFCLQNIASMLDLQLKPYTNEQKLICDWTKLWYWQICSRAVRGSNCLILYMIPTYRDILDITVLTWRDQLSGSSTITPRNRVSVVLSIGVWEIFNGQERATLLLENIRYLVFLRLSVRPLQCTQSSIRDRLSRTSTGRRISQEELVIKCREVLRKPHVQVKRRLAVAQGRPF